MFLWKKGGQNNKGSVGGSAVTGTARPARAPQWPFSWAASRQEVLVRITKLITLYQPEEFGKGQKRDTACPTTSQNPSLWHPSWLSDASTTRKGSVTG